MDKERKPTKQVIIKKRKMPKEAVPYQWKPGQSGNPKGRAPKVKCIPDILRKIGAEEIDTREGKITKLEAVLRATYAYGIKGKSWAVEFIADRMEGKPLQRSEIAGFDGGPIIGRLLDMNEAERAAELKTLMERRRGDGD